MGLNWIVDYPEIRPYIAAVVSVAGTIGGSPLAYDFDQGDLDLLRTLSLSGRESAPMKTAPSRVANAR